MVTDLYSVTFGQVMDAYRTRNLQPRDLGLMPDQSGRCCALGALYDFSEPVPPWVSIGVTETDFTAFAYGFDDGFSGRSAKVPGYPKANDLYLHAVSIGKQIRLWNQSRRP